MLVSPINQNVSFKAFSATLFPNRKINIGKHPNISSNNAGMSEVEYAKLLTKQLPLGKDNLEANFYEQSNGLVEMGCITKPGCNPAYENFVRRELIRQGIIINNDISDNDVFIKTIPPLGGIQ